MQRGRLVDGEQRARIIWVGGQEVSGKDMAGPLADVGTGHAVPAKMVARFGAALGAPEVGGGIDEGVVEEAGAAAVQDAHALLAVHKDVAGADQALGDLRRAPCHSPRPSCSRTRRQHCRHRTRPRSSWGGR